MSASLTQGVGQSLVGSGATEIETVACLQEGRPQILAKVRFRFQNDSQSRLITSKLWTEAHTALWAEARGTSTKIADQAPQPSQDEPALSQVPDGISMGKANSLLRTVAPRESFDVTVLIPIPLSQTEVTFLSVGVHEYTLLVELRPLPAIDEAAIASIQRTLGASAALAVGQISASRLLLHPTPAHSDRHCHDWNSLGDDRK